MGPPHLRKPGAPCALAASLALLFASETVRADGPLGPNGAPIRTSQYGVDLTQTPVLAGARPLALGGAYVAIAETTDGNFHNPAAPAVRVPYSFDWFDWDVGLDVVSASAVEKNDFFNTGQPTTTGTEKNQDVFANLAANLQFGPWGFGLAFQVQTYALRTADDARLDASTATLRPQVARNFLDDQLVIGAGPALASLEVGRPNPPEGESPLLLQAVNVALEAGAVWKPNERPYRLGLSVRSPILADTNDDPPVPPNAAGDYVYGDPASPDAIFLPRTPALPWEVRAGVAVQLGPRPLNPRWTDPREAEAKLEAEYEKRDKARAARRRALVSRLEAEGAEGADSGQTLAALDKELDRERAADAEALERQEDRLRDERRAAYWAMARFYVLVTASVRVTGSVDDAVGIESFLRQEVDRSGQHVTYSPHLGVETEAVPHLLKLRAGSYYEPTRFDNGLAGRRLHGTAGFALKVLPWTVFGLFDDPTWWRVGAVLDVADRYFSYGFTAGIWH